MQYILIAIVLMVLCLFGLSCRKSTPAGSEQDPLQPIAIAEGQYLSRQDIQEQLAKIAKTPPPEKLAHGAMCYSPIAPPSRIEYVCPDCGEKTYYAAEVPDDNVTRPYSRFVVWYLQEIDNYRRLVQQIDKLNVQLDESEFCRLCNPDTKEPQLAIIIRHSDSTESHRVESVFTELDLKILKAFNDGKFVFTLSNDGEITLQKQMDRLEELLGVKLDDTEQP